MAAHDETLAQTYADALLELTWEKGVHAEVLAELREFGEVLAREEGFRAFLNTPRIRQQVKKEVVEKVFGAVVSDYTLNFLRIVIDKRRQAHLPRMIEAYEAGYHERAGELVVKVETAAPLEPAQADRLKRALKKKYDKEIILRERLNERLLGGLVLRVGDARIDGSLRTRLEAIGARLEGARFRSEDYYEDQG